MSDPVTNLEIEDVLSSIRRLVSEDARPRSKPLTRPASGPARMAVDKPDRLVLTPAQRVPGDDSDSNPAELLADDAAEAGPGPAPEPEPEPEVDEAAADALFFHADPDGRATDPSLPDGMAEHAPEDDAEPESRSDFIGRLVTDEVQRMLAADEDAPDPAPAEAAQTAPDDADEDTLSAKIAALEALIARGSDPEPFYIPPPEQPAPAETAAFVHRAVESLEWEDHNETPEPAARIVETPPAPTRAADAAEPAPEALVLGGPPWRGSTEPEPSNDAPRDLALDEPQGEQQGAVLAIDETVLRDMVSDIVRQELQGALGERITRNVRKLVRREIHRMLVSQELD